MTDRIRGVNRKAGAGQCRICGVPVFLTTKKKIQTHWSSGQQAPCVGATYAPRAVQDA